MTPPPRTILGRLTQVVQGAAKVDFSKLRLKPNARVTELRVQSPEDSQPQVYPLLGDRYVIGRSRSRCDIAIQSPLVSQIHLTIQRDRRQATRFFLRDEKSTNGTYIGKRRVQRSPLFHNQRFTLGPPGLADAVQVQYINPPPIYILVLRYLLLGISGLFFLILLWILVQWQQVQIRPLPPPTGGPVVVYARDGETPLSPPTTVTHRELSRLRDFSPYLPDAVLASEDSRFNWHLGVDPIGILRAIVTNLRSGELREGASTLTQQVARSLFPSYVGRDDSAGRKLREMLVALKLELTYSKNDILLIYLNRVYLGYGNYGFEDAAQFFFAKSAKDLTLSEAATLAGILPAPNRVNPVQDYQAAIEYRNRILKRMVAQGRVSEAEANQARRSRIEINPKAKEQLQSNLAPYFYSYIFSELEELLGVELAQEGNFIVESTLDLNIQKKSDQALRQAVSTLGTEAGFSQGAIVTLDTQTGGILALTGGVDFSQSQFNRATQALRQPGSTFKVFAYTAAIAAGTSPYATYSCSPLSWDGQVFAGCRSGDGEMTVAQGLALSENVVALRIAKQVGLNSVVSIARRLGIKSDLKPVPGLVLGQSEVTPLEMTGAFAALNNRGIFNPPHAIARILDGGTCKDQQDRNSCALIYSHEQDAAAGQAAIAPEVANTMTQLLQGVVQAGTGTNAAVRSDIAGKTGTTNDNVDLWFIGYSPTHNIAAGIWLGNDDNAPTSGSSAQAAQLWGDYMAQVLP